jgi:hypothetical protein
MSAWPAASARSWLLIAALALAACASAPRAETAPSPDAVALTFGRCESGANACPRPADPKAAGDAALQSALLKCFRTELGRPVYVLGDAPIPQGYWLDAGVKPANDGPGRVTITFRLWHGPDTQLEGFLFMLPADAPAYREVCRQFSERARPRLK